MKIGISTFGGDGGKSGISQYIIQLMREFARQPDGCTFEVIGYGDERAVFVPESGGITHLPFGGNLRSPIRNVFWHQTSLPRYCRERAFDVLFLPAGNRRLPLYSPCPTVGRCTIFPAFTCRESTTGRACCTSRACCRFWSAG